MQDNNNATTAAAASSRSQDTSHRGGQPSDTSSATRSSSCPSSANPSSSTSSRVTTMTARSEIAGSHASSSPQPHPHHPHSQHCGCCEPSLQNNNQQQPQPQPQPQEDTWTVWWEELRVLIRQIYSEIKHNDVFEDGFTISFEKTYNLVYRLCKHDPELLFYKLEKEARIWLESMCKGLVAQLSYLTLNKPDTAAAFLLLLLNKYEDLCSANEIFNGVFIYLHNCFLKQFDVTLGDINKGLFWDLIQSDPVLQLHIPHLKSQLKKNDAVLQQYLRLEKKMKKARLRWKKLKKQFQMYEQERANMAREARLKAECQQLLSKRCQHHQHHHHLCCQPQQQQQQQSPVEKPVPHATAACCPHHHHHNHSGSVTCKHQDSRPIDTERSASTAITQKKTAPPSPSPSIQDAKIVSAPSPAPAPGSALSLASSPSTSVIPPHSHYRHPPPNYTPPPPPPLQQQSAQKQPVIVDDRPLEELLSFINGSKPHQQQQAASKAARNAKRKQRKKQQQKKKKEEATKQAEAGFVEKAEDHHSVASKTELTKNNYPASSTTSSSSNSPSASPSSSPSLSSNNKAQEVLPSPSHSSSSSSSSTPTSLAERMAQFTSFPHFWEEEDLDAEMDPALRARQDEEVEAFRRRLESVSRQNATTTNNNHNHNNKSNKSCLMSFEGSAWKALSEMCRAQRESYHQQSRMSFVE
ncbi:hypothetical protein QOT17_009007 [Balamuthia mandrillaris]